MPRTSFSKSAQWLQLDEAVEEVLFKDFIDVRYWLLADIPMSVIDVPSLSISGNKNFGPYDMIGQILPYHCHG